jgi:hypothetical protein
MKNRLKLALMSTLVAMAGIALAVPEFVFVKDAKSNGMMMMMGNKEVIELAAYPALRLIARNVTKKQAEFIYAGTDLKGAFGFYEKALVKEGWKAAGMMGDAMNKDGSTMNKDGSTMNKDDSTMNKDDSTMNKEGSAMMAKPLTEKFTFKTYSITLTAKAGKDRVEVDLVLK